MEQGLGMETGSIPKLDTGHATPFEQMGLAASAYGVIHGGRAVMQSLHT